MDDATSEHYSMFFVEEEGTASSFLGVKEVIEEQGLFCSLYTDRASHYWYTPEVGGKVDKTRLTQFGRAMHQLGIEMIPAYSPEARGRSERAFRTHQDRLPKELAAAGVTDMQSANCYLRDFYKPAYNAEFMHPAAEQGSGFVRLLSHDIDDILCEHHQRTVGKDNCVAFEAMALQIPQDRYRMHYVKVKVRVHRYPDGRLAVFHGPRKLQDYNADGTPLAADKKNSLCGTRKPGGFAPQGLTLSCLPDEQKRPSPENPGTAHPFRHPQRRSGRSPALPYPPADHLTADHLTVEGSLEKNNNSRPLERR
jgi:hypothetical protein